MFYIITLLSPDPGTVKHQSVCSRQVHVCTWLRGVFISAPSIVGGAVAHPNWHRVKNQSTDSPPLKSYRSGWSWKSTTEHLGTVCCAHSWVENECESECLGSSTSTFQSQTEVSSSSDPQPPPPLVSGGHQHPLFVTHTSLPQHDFPL